MGIVTFLRFALVARSPGFTEPDDQTGNQRREACGRLRDRKIRTSDPLRQRQQGMRNSLFGRRLERKTDGRGSLCSRHDSTILRARPCAISTVSATARPSATRPGTSGLGPRIASFFQCFHAHTDCDFFHFGEMHSAFPDSPPAFNQSVLFSALQGSIKADVLEVDGLSIDAALGRGDPASHFAALEDTVHQAVHKGAVV